MPLEGRVRTSYLKEDCEEFAVKLASITDISPYNTEQLGTMIVSGFRSGDVESELRSNRWHIKNIDGWFNQKVLPNTVVLTKEDYQVALFSAFKLLILGKIAKTDFGTSRQRDFGHMWTDFTRGYLGEIGIKKFMNKRLKLDVKLEEVRVGDVKEFIQRDIVKVKDGQNVRDVRAKISIKTSKLNAIWLDIGNQIGHSDFFIFMKIGLKTDHYPTYMKESGAVELLLKSAVSAGEIPKEKFEEAKNELYAKIPDFRALPAYVAGYVSKQDLEEGELEVEEWTTKKRNGTEETARMVIGGRGYYDTDTADEVLGIGDIGTGKHLASISSLRWKQEDWNTIKEKI